MAYSAQSLTTSTGRRYYVYAPDVPKAAAIPAIIVFHGSGQRIDTIAKRWGISISIPLSPPAPLVQDYMLVFPESDPGLNWRWVHYQMRDKRFPDHDLKFIDEVIGDITSSTFGPANVTADTNRLYAAGFSNGAGMTWQLAFSDRYTQFKGFACVGKALDPEKVDYFIDNWAAGPVPADAVPLMYIHGTADPTFRSAFMRDEHDDLTHTYPYYSVSTMMKRNGIASGSSATSSLLPGSTNETEVISQLFMGGSAAFNYTSIINGAHNWPTPATISPAPVAKHFNATKTIIDFWQAHAGLP